MNRIDLLRADRRPRRDGACDVPSAWPVDRDFDIFIRRFEYRFHSEIIDLGDDPVIHDEL